MHDMYVDVLVAISVPWLAWHADFVEVPVGSF
jgi:hypothetical protein